jgi:hypothetical protein
VNQIAKQLSQPQATLYAAGADFCRIFKQEMNSLYLLSFLLTGERALAEQCFVGGLEDATRSSRVFKEWADRWARRAIVQNAIQVVEPRPGEIAAARNGDDNRVLTSQADAACAEIASIVALPPFERFVFVMSVLERYSDQDCSLMLDSTREQVTTARLRALQQIGRLAEFHRANSKAKSGQSEDRAQSKSQSGVPQAALAPGEVAQLAASA